MENTIASPRPGRPRPSAGRCGCKAGSAPAATPRAASASWNSTTARAWATSRSSPRRPCRTTRARSSTSAPAAASPSRASQGLARQGAGDRGAGRAASSCTAGPIPRPIRCRRSGIRSSSCARSPICGRGPTPSGPSPGCAIASAARSTISFRSKAFSTSTRRSSRPATAKGPARCSRSPRSTWPTCPSNGRRRSTIDQDFFDRPAYLTVSGQLEGEIFACALGKVYTFGPTFRAENSNTSRHLAEFWMVEPEMAFFELADNMELAEAFLQADLPRRAGAMPATTWSSSTSAIDKTVIDTLEGDRRQRVRAADLHRGGRHPGEVGPDVRVPGRLGARPAGRARALSDREALPEPGDPVRLSRARSSRSTCA